VPLFYHKLTLNEKCGIQVEFVTREPLEMLL